MVETSAATAGQRIGRVDMVFCTTWEVEAPLDDVYPAVVDFRAWQGYDSVQLVSGVQGEEGELIIIKKPESEMAWQEKYCGTIKLDPLRQVIWRIYTGPGQVGPDGWEYEYSGTVDYRFEANGPQKTTIFLQVIKEFFVPHDDETELAEVQAAEYKFQTEVAEHFRPRLLELLAQQPC
jgi:hypothetical protein